MTVRNIWVVLTGALWLGILGVLGGAAVDRLPFANGAMIIAQLEEAPANVSAQLTVLGDVPWEASVHAVDVALASDDRALAQRAWRDAWHAPLAGRRWEGLAAAGDAALRMGETGRAREAFLTTLFRARAQNSFAGVLRAAEAFETLGDQAVARQCLRVAEAMPGISAVERELVRERVERLAGSAGAAGRIR